ncbi:DUF6090 family protein [Lutimonas halocynthiae]|uniref:DUF6090 family protein n=1 Tax=Lutimonas halocynthiae TaxID=1446477 RepID=UPI0025B58989|nr:DUF6090 family protein [Lutimonas halocynthiae]MDN3642910.1 DUF6090 family protein [Lutimonas halocynthiae]
MADDNRPLKYARYAMGEIVLVVIGILIALQINTWNEERKENKIEGNYLKEMLEDYQTNLSRSEKVIKEYESMIPTLKGLIEQSLLEKPSISVDSLNKACMTINNMPTYSSSDRVYNNLIGSGDLKLLKNKALKTELSFYFEKLNILKLVQTTHELELVESFQPYIIDHMDFLAVAPRRLAEYRLPTPNENDKILEVLHDSKFRNIITLKWVIITDLLEQNRELEQININILELLKEYY